MKTNGNTLLLGSAIELPQKVRKEIQFVLEREGFWIASDTRRPGEEVPLVSIGGKIYCMKIDKELDPSRFYKTVELAGPFRAKGHALRSGKEG